MRSEYLFAGVLAMCVLGINYALLWFMDYVVSFWSLNLLTIVLLVVGVVVPQKKAGS